MKKVVLLCVLGLLPSMVMAGPTIKMLNDSNPAYTAQILEDGFAGYAAGSVVSTFCLEVKEVFHPGRSYYAVLGTEAVYGGKDWAGGVYGQGPLQTVSSDPLDERSAFLFTRFNEGDSRFTDQKKLAAAIHYIEGETTARNSYVDLAEAAVDVNGEWFGMGIGDVRVMSLWSNYDGQTYSGKAQDQLIMVQPVPAPGAILLAGSGVLMTGWLKRRKRV